MTNSFFKNYRLDLLIIFSWFILFSANHFLLESVKYNDYISLIFLPAGIRIMFATIFRGDAWRGLFFGSLLTGFVYLESLSAIDIVIFSILSTLSPLLAVLIINFFSSYGKRCELLTFKHTIFIALTYAIFCSVFHNLYIFLQEKNLEAFILDTGLMFIGDITGALIFLHVLALFRIKIVKFLLTYHTK
jgi:hypothetical protein